MSLGLAATLKLDESAEVAKIAERVRELLRGHLHRRGLVVAISGGIDSSVCAALAVRAVGRERVIGLLLPERDSASESSIRGRMVVEQLGIALSERQIQKHCADKLEAFMMPKHLTVLPELPKSPNGKIDKKALVATLPYS